VVHDSLVARDEEEREVDPGEDEEDEAVHRDLAEHERPVVREHLVERRPREAQRTEPVAVPPDEAWITTADR
jgi:hypothetical protein